MIQAFLKATPILTKIESAGFEAYFVGGSVRDYLLGKEIEDVDIATSATPDEVKSLFPRTIDVGIEHGTIIVLYEADSYEITTFRTESDYENFRRPKEVSFVRSLEADLQRRDFTMNAIAMDKSGVIYDPFDGKNAILAKELKTVGEAKERFQEDALRMMRAVRFVSQLSFSIEKQTLQALKQYHRLLGNISVERVTTEFEKLLQGRNCKEAFAILIQTDLYECLPGLAGQEQKLWEFHDKLDDSLTIEELWSFLLLHILKTNEGVETFLRQWRLPLKKIKHIAAICKHVRFRLTQEWTVDSLYHSNQSIIGSSEKLVNILKGNEPLWNVEEVIQMYAELPIKNRGDLDVTGKELMEWFSLGSGPWINEKLIEIEKAVLHNKIKNRKETIREWLMECNPS